MPSYDDILPGDSFDRWHQATCRNYSLTECDPIPDRDFQARVAVRSLGDFATSRIASRVRGGRLLRVSRRESEIRRDGRDDYFLWVGEGGTTTLTQNGASATIRAGDMMLMDQARPFSLDFGPVSATTMIIIPRRLLIERLRDPAPLLARRIAGDAATTRLAANLAQQCHEISRLYSASGMARQIAQSAIDIWSAVLQAAGPISSSGDTPFAERLVAVQAHMRQHLDDPELTLERIGQVKGLSTRTLLRLFAAQGTTPMRWLWEERLRHGQRGLVAGRYASVTEAALACGFKDLSHFSRAFKARYGVAPVAVLRGCKET